MRILVINPNSTASMTAAIGAAARRAAAPGTAVAAVNPPDGPAAIQGAADGEAALPGLFAVFEREVMQAQACDAVVIACFDDTGLRALKARSPVPVVGIGEAGFLAAMLVAERFSVVTTLPVSVPVIEANLAAYGWAGRCARVRASGVAVLQLEGSEPAVVERIAAEIEQALDEDACQAIVLGCAGMTDLAGAMTERFGVPVIDGVTAAVALCEALQRAGIDNAPRQPMPAAMP